MLNLLSIPMHAMKFPPYKQSFCPLHSEGSFFFCSSAESVCSFFCCCYCCYGSSLSLFFIWTQTSKRWTTTPEKEDVLRMYTNDFSPLGVLFVRFFFSRLFFFLPFWKFCLSVCLHARNFKGKPTCKPKKEKKKRKSPSKGKEHINKDMLPGRRRKRWKRKENTASISQFCFPIFWASACLLFLASLAEATRFSGIFYGKFENKTVRHVFFSKAPLPWRQNL